MVQIISNNLRYLIDQKLKESAAPLEDREKILESLREHIPNNRLSGLLRNSYKLSIDELFISAAVLQVDPKDLVSTVTTEKW